MSIVVPREFPSPLRQAFEGSDKYQFSYSQAWQDIFVLVVLNGLIGGKYLEIGAGDARNINNTYLLERYFAWTGLSLDIDPRAVRSYKLHRRNRCELADACEADICNLLAAMDFGNHVDYLQVDIEPSTTSLVALKRVMQSGLRPRVVTFETDFYNPHVNSEISKQVRQESRDFMRRYGYELVAGDLGSTSSADPFEDWYVDPSQVEKSRLQVFENLPKEPMASEVALFKGPFIVATELYDGQGLGNQLWVYAVTRLAALKQGFDFGIGGRDNFKGQDFIEIDFGYLPGGGLTNEGGPPLKLPEGFRHYYSEQKLVHTPTLLDVSIADKKMWMLPPNTKVDGNFQSYEYLKDHEDLIRSWIVVKPQRVSDLSLCEDVCLVHVRGGDFKNLKNTALGPDYYRNSIAYVRSKFGVKRFVAITDDVSHAESVLPQGVEIHREIVNPSTSRTQARHHMGKNIEADFSYLKQSNYLIISNSSFAWWAAFLNTKCRVVVAPKFWAAHNNPLQIWSTAEIITPGFTYIDTQGRTYSAEECQSELRSDLQVGANNVVGGSVQLSNLREFVRGRLKFWAYLIRFWLIKSPVGKFVAIKFRSFVRHTDLTQVDKY